MIFEIQAVRFKASDELKDRVTEKMEKLADHFPFITSFHAYLKEEPNGQTVEVEARLKSAGELFAKSTDTTFENAIDQVEEKLERQLRKHKDKLLNHHQ